VRQSTRSGRCEDKEAEKITALVALWRAVLPIINVNLLDANGEPVKLALAIGGEASARRIPCTAEILREMLDELKDLGRSHKHLHGLQNDLAPFASRFPDLRQLGDNELVSYLRELCSRVGPRRRDNIRGAIVQLSRFSRRRNYLPEERRSVAEKIPRIKPGHDVSTWTPAEAKLRLEHVSERWLPCVVTSLFAGLRRSEIFRLDWSAFKWDLRNRDGSPAPVIAVTRKVARKVRVDRLVPILPNLASWLEPYRDYSGPLYPGTSKANENAHSQETLRIRRLTGLPRKDNADRHSFGSYRLAVTRNYEQVALEMGNSARKVREDYNDPKSEAEGLAFFALERPSFDNVIPMRLALEFK
jgi:integrase